MNGYGGPAEYALQQQAQQRQNWQNILNMILAVKQQQYERDIQERSWNYTLAQDAIKNQLARQKMEGEQGAAKQSREDLKSYRESSLALSRDKEVAAKARHDEAMKQGDERIRQGWAKISADAKVSADALARIDAQAAAAYKRAYGTLLNNYQTQAANIRKDYDKAYLEAKAGGNFLQPDWPEFEKTWRTQLDSSLSQLWQSVSANMDALASEFGVPGGTVPAPPMPKQPVAGTPYEAGYDKTNSKVNSAGQWIVFDGKAWVPWVQGMVKK